jgi:baculoviral IAP repeat-containing protein 6
MVYCTTDSYLSKYQEPIKPLLISNNIKEEYCHIMKNLQFGTFDIPSVHRFYKVIKYKPEQKALMRILSEVTSFKSGLPLNWESTIWIRVSRNNINIVTFLISGPKDTPYENGLFEFHAYFPPDYPNSPPKVLLHTTGNDTVRFNPNLYNCGKVCLSLLGTWNGQEGEKWNAKTSTFLQVMVSIQSLILVELPYFNEPGWEREMGTSAGKTNSALYNESKKPYTIKLAMTEMIKNPPSGFEQVIKEHFKMKKEEIINRTLIWEQNTINSNNLAKIIENRKELIETLEMNYN